MTPTAAADRVEAHVPRALAAADKLFLALEGVEAPGGLGPALAARNPTSRAEVVARLRSARDPLDAALRIGRPRPGRRHINIRKICAKKDGTGGAPRGPWRTQGVRGARPVPNGVDAYRHA